MAEPDVLSGPELRASVYGQTFDHLGRLHAIDVEKFWVRMAGRGTVDGVSRPMRARVMSLMLRSGPDLQQWSAALEVAEASLSGHLRRQRNWGRLRRGAALVLGFSILWCVATLLWGERINSIWLGVLFLPVAFVVAGWGAVRESARKSTACVAWACARGFHVPDSYPAWADEIQSPAVERLGACWGYQQGPIAWLIVALSLLLDPCRLAPNPLDRFNQIVSLSEFCTVRSADGAWAGSSWWMTAGGAGRGQFDSPFAGSRLRSAVPPRGRSLEAAEERRSEPSGPPAVNRLCTRGGL